ncbi:hypothetical protein K9B33_17865 [Sphingobium sp. 3R8]|uniref:hypothetical protein n=1 Tax=Sphingobium sp. 3R8 TaxID=2874921 RepID=UPI001CCF7F2F|nr:hypothetical protein [Sphingobium sp. 3R8]MBZ9649405.1 hypothetical protein [Sphingobium sp. 3R8]
MTQLSYAIARINYLVSLAAYNAADFTGMTVDEDEAFTNAHYDKWDAVLQAPATSSADLLEKMTMIDERYIVDCEAIPDVDWKALKRDVAALATSQIAPPSAACADNPTWQAWLHFADDAWKDDSDRAGTEQARAGERLLADCTAASPLGVAGKLRYALYLNATTQWLRALALGADVPDLVAKLDMEDAVNQALWSSIQSLEAMDARP